MSLSEMEPLSLAKQEIMALLNRRSAKLTPAVLIKTIRARLPALSTSEARSALHALVESGELAYFQLAGATYLGKGYRGSAQVSRRICIHTGYGLPETVNNPAVIRLVGGAAFGSGDHPTTRLALCGLDLVLAHNSAAREKALDVGTGSGVLAIAAALLGIKQVIGVDPDPVACHEAKMNAEANGVQRQVQVVFGTLSAIEPDFFDIVTANLRPPTLIELAGAMRRLTRENGIWVLSGFRSKERHSLERGLKEIMHELWSGTENGWCAVAYRVARKEG